MVLDKWAENGRKAADTAVLWGADLILMDIEMPGMSGLDAARAVLAQRPSCRVIFVTAYSLFQYAHEAVHLGACDYLLKPVDPDELEASVRRAMRQIETERKLEELAAAQPQPEQTETEEEAEDAPEESENSQTALVMAHVRRYLEDNYMFDLSLDSVGEILHISPAYLSAQFKKYQKMNFLDCLTELRINAAKELLADPFRSSAEVASMVGYEDASYFARAFKKRTGMTPTQYRRQAGQKAKADPERRAVSGRMISRRSVLALAACTALGAVGCSKTEEYTGPELILRYAENQPEDYPTTQAALAFADLVAERTEEGSKSWSTAAGSWGPNRASSSRCSMAASTLPASP